MAKNFRLILRSCIVILAATVLITASCSRLGFNTNGEDHIPPRPSVTELKYPENTDEVADFFEVFSDRSLTAEQAVKQLHLTGTPVSTPTEQGSRDTYPSQNELIKNVEIVVYQGHLDQIHLVYSRPIKISFEQLKTLITPRYQRPPPGSVGSLSAPRSLTESMYAANVPEPIQLQGTPTNGRQTYSFTASGRTSIGRVTVSAEDDGSGNSPTGTRSVWEIGFYR